jgi:hypothetical protein
LRRGWIVSPSLHPTIDQRKNVESPISYDVFLHALGRRYRTIRHLIPPGTNPIAKGFKDANNSVGRPEFGEIDNKPSVMID